MESTESKSSPYTQTLEYLETNHQKVHADLTSSNVSFSRGAEVAEGLQMPKARLIAPSQLSQRVSKEQPLLIT